MYTTATAETVTAEIRESFRPDRLRHARHSPKHAVTVPPHTVGVETMTLDDVELVRTGR